MFVTRIDTHLSVLSSTAWPSGEEARSVPDPSAPGSAQAWPDVAWFHVVATPSQGPQHAEGLNRRRRLLAAIVHPQVDLRVLDHGVCGNLREIELQQGTEIAGAHSQVGVRDEVRIRIPAVDVRIE